MKSSKVFAILAISVAIGGVSWIAVGNLGENLVYYWTPSELIAKGATAKGATVRLGGVVKPGSIVPGTPLTFEVSDGTSSSATVKVTTSQIPPAMFREGIGVVVEGTISDSGTFESKRLMVKHDNEYRAPTDGSMPDEAAMFGTLSDDDAPGSKP